MKPANTWSLVRFIIPAFPEINSFSRADEKTALLRTINMATAADKSWGFKVEVIDENNFYGPRDEQWLPNHEKLQEENFASVVVFYCGFPFIKERVFKLAEFYRKYGAVTLVGGQYVHYYPQEALNNNINIVVHGSGEITIWKILNALREGKSVSDIPGISLRRGIRKKTNPPPTLESDDLPPPDFNLLKYTGEKIESYPIGRTRSCRIKGKSLCASPHYLFKVVGQLVKNQKARKFFIIDDCLEEDIEGNTEFFKMIREKYGNRLKFTVRIRSETAKNVEFLEIMKKAGVTRVNVDYESLALRKLRSSRRIRMIEQTKILRRYFSVQGVFTFGYPYRASDRIKRFEKFIKEAGLSSIEILHSVPFPGTDLYKKLEIEKRIFPRDKSPKGFQEAPINIMRWFYSSFSFLHIPVRILALHHFLKEWLYRYCRLIWRKVIRYNDHFLFRQWQKRHRENLFNLFLVALEKSQPRTSP